MYMGDMQYLFMKAEIGEHYPNGLYIQASTKDRVATFMMEF